MIASFLLCVFFSFSLFLFLCALLLVQALQCNVKTFDIRYCAIRNTVTSSAITANWELSFTLQYHEQKLVFKGVMISR